MPRHRAAELVLVPIAALIVMCQDVVWPFVLAVARAIADWRLLAPLRRRVSRLPAMVALPLFLIPEGLSRLGTLVSAWLLLQGDGWRALAVYAGSKLVVGMTALWIYTACEPALLQVPAFAAVHRALGLARRTVVARARALAPRSGRLAARMRRLRGQSTEDRAVPPP